MKADEMKEQIIKKPNIYDYPSTDERTFVELDGKVNWEKYAKALDEFIILAECKSDHSEDKLDKVDKQGGWICPRCQKVHRWMVQHCDCPPKVITASTTDPIPGSYLNDCIEKATPNLSKIKDVDRELEEIRGENNCNNCAYGICLTKDWPCADCDGSNKWEPIKTE